MQVKNKFTKDNLRKYLRFFIFLTNIVAILLLLLSTLAWTILPSKVTAISYLGMGFPFLLVINIAYLVFWGILLRWKLALVQIVALAICWNPISTYFPMHLRTQTVPDDCIKVFSYNVRGFNWLAGDTARRNPMLDYIAGSGADIICLQEFVVAIKKDKTGIISEEEFNRKMKNYPYRQIVRLGEATSSYYKYGIACYSKYSIEKTAAIPIVSTYNGSSIHEIKIKDKTITLVNNHLESNRITAEDKKLYKNFAKKKDSEMLETIAHNIQSRLGVAFRLRENQANIIKSYIDKQKTDATIICGDFNDTPISYAYHQIKGDMIDSYAHTGFGPGITYHENKFWFRIDYIIHSSNLESYNCTIGDIKYSDHYPIWSYLRFN